MGIKDDVISTLQQLSVCKPNSSETQWVVRCPYCGDSTKSNHGHFSIKIDRNTNDLMVYRCFKCNEAGILTTETLEALNLYNDTLNKSLSVFNITASKGASVQHKDKKYKIPVPYDTHTNRYKLGYLNRRLGTSLTLDDCPNNGVILSLKEFLRYNGLPSWREPDGPLIKKAVLEAVDDYYIGFLSSNKNKLTFRDCTNESFLGRYYKVTLDPNHTSINNFYLLQGNIELMYSGELNVHITEGTFDILSVYHNIFNGNAPQNSIFVASCGFSFNTIINYLVRMGVTTDIVVHIYADNDKSDSDIIKSIGSTISRVWIDKIIIHRNQFKGEKDFGVPMNRIDMVTYRLQSWDK